MFGILKLSLEQTKEEKKKLQIGIDKQKQIPEKKACFIHEVKYGKYCSFLNRCCDITLDHIVFIQTRKDCRPVLRWASVEGASVEVNQTEIPGI